MNPEDEVSRPQTAFSPTERVYIANLQQEDHSDASGAYIDAQIALVWPYSSSTRQFAFLLSETDVRPLKLSRQVKVTLYNGAARAVQTAKFGIGDRVRLSLHGCRWQDSGDTASTPGKRIKWDLAYRKAISLEINPSAADEQIRVVRYESTGTPSPRHSIVTNGTAPSASIEARYESPELPATARTSFSFRTSGVHSHGTTPNDPFLEDIEQESGRKRKRTKFARPSGAWKLLDDDQVQSSALPSSTLALLGSERGNGLLVQNELDVQDRVDESIPDPASGEALTTEDVALQADEVLPSNEPDHVLHEKELDKPVQDVEQTGDVEIEIMQPMGPPMPPSRSLQDMRLQLPTESLFDLDERATTPRLNPLRSPGLPLISPLIKRSGVETGYFSSTVAGASELDASAVSHGLETTIDVAAGVPLLLEGDVEELEPEGLDVPVADEEMAPDALDNGEQGGDLRTNANEPIVIDLEETSTEESDAEEVDDRSEEVEDSSEDDLVEEEAHVEDTRQAEEDKLAEEDDSEKEEQLVEEHENVVIDEDLAAAEHTVPVTHTAVEALINDSKTQEAAGSLLVPTTTIDGRLAEDITQNAIEPTASNVLEQLPPGLEEGLTHEAEEPELAAIARSSPEVQPAATKDTTVDLEIETIQAVVEEPTYDQGPSSPMHAVDGSAEPMDVEVPEHVRLLQGGFERHGAVKPDIFTPPASSRPDVTIRKPQSVASPSPETEQRPSVEAQPDIVVVDQDESAASLPEQPLRVAERQLPTPDQTQQQPEVTIIDQPLERSAEPRTPQDTQKDTEEIQLEPLPSALEKTPSPPLAINEAMAGGSKSPESRRVSQRLSRKSNSFKAIESPFFSDRNPAEVASDEPKPMPALDLRVPQTRRTRQSKTPERVLQDVELPSAKGKQVAKQTGTTTSLSYYPSFQKLQDYYGQSVDIIAICAEASTQPVKAKTGPRDWHTSLRLVDPETPDVRVTAQAFRPYKDALPSANVGDIVILRSFKVQTAKHKWQLLSTDASAWAVFKSDPDSREMFEKVDMTGPQLEYGRGETTRVKELVRWWSEQGGAVLGPDKGDAHDKADSQVVVHETPDGEAAILQSVEQPSSPRRSRRKQPPVEEPHEGTTVEPSTQKSLTPQPTRHQPPRRARTKTPNPPQPQPPPSGPSSSPRAAATPTSPRHTRRRTRSTLSPAASLAEAAPASAASSLAATSPTEATFAAPSAKLGGSKKGKTRPKAQAKSKDTPQEDAQQVVDEGPDSAQPQGPDEEDDSNKKGTRRHTRHTNNARTGSPPLVHELRDGMRYVDKPEAEGGGNAKQRTRVTRGQVHELRDGVRYVDD